MRLNKIAALAGLLGTMCFCIGWADTWDGIRTAAEQVDSIAAEFVQTKHLPILARPLVSTGVFYFQKPDALRWEYRQPVKSILLMNDGSLQRFRQSGDELKAESGPGLEAMGFVMAEISHWLRGRFDQSRMFTARLETGRKVVLLPKEAAFARFIQKIELLLADAPGIIEAVIIYESSDSFTRLTFENTRLNTTLSPDLFRGVE